MNDCGNANTIDLRRHTHFLPILGLNSQYGSRTEAPRFSCTPHLGASEWIATSCRTPVSAGSRTQAQTGSRATLPNSLSFHGTYVYIELPTPRHFKTVALASVPLRPMCQLRHQRVYRVNARLWTVVRPRIGWIDFSKRIKPFKLQNFGNIQVTWILWFVA